MLTTFYCFIDSTWSEDLTNPLKFWYLFIWLEFSSIGVTGFLSSKWVLQMLWFLMAYIVVAFVFLSHKIQDKNTNKILFIIGFPFKSVFVASSMINLGDLVDLSLVSLIMIHLGWGDDDLYTLNLWYFVIFPSFVMFINFFVFCYFSFSYFYLSN